MLHKPLTLATLLLTFALPAMAGGKAEVEFDKPENFTDIGWSERDRQETLGSLTDWFNKLATRLPDGQVLQVQVTDIDLAGQVLPFTAQNLRLATGRADWPRINLRYTLVDGSRTVKAGEASLFDLSYLQRRVPATLQRDSFGYEKRMLKEWFEQTFTTPQRSATP